MLQLLRKIKQKIWGLGRVFKRRKNPAQWHNLRRLEPVSRVFGFDRGTPIDRVYTDDFLAKNAALIRGVVCEIADDSYAKKFGRNVEKIEILHYTSDNPKATIVGDLTRFERLPSDFLDCFICTVTLNFIYDYKRAILGLHSMLKRGGGAALVTVCGLSQISRYDYERWGDYWRFCDLGIRRDFEAVFGAGNVEVEIYGNVLAACAELQGIAAEELSREELFHKDPDYQIIITIVARKP